MTEDLLLNLPPGSLGAGVPFYPSTEVSLAAARLIAQAEQIQAGIVAYPDDAVIGVPVGGGGGAVPETWFLADGTNLVPLHYHRSANVVNSASVVAPAGGATYLYTTVHRALNQDGLVRRVWAWVIATGSAAWKAKVFRPNGSSYDLVGECAFTPSTTGLQSFDLDTPVECAPGDKLAVFLPEGAELSVHNTAATHTYNWSAGDIVTSDAFATQVTEKSLNFVAYGYQPWLVAVGDSIYEGHNTASPWHSLYDQGPGGTPSAEIWNQMRDLYMPGLQYQNYAKGSQQYSWVNNSGFAEAYTTFGLKASVWLMGAGVNDVSAGRAWEDVEADLDAIRARCAAGDLWIAEILPWTTASDAQAATTRDWNANFLTWCAANSAHLLSVHDDMGQLRVSTGELDDLKDEYSQDGVHLTQEGVNRYAQLVYQQLRLVYAT